jgi:hypothetical protein
VVVVPYPAPGLGDGLELVPPATACFTNAPFVLTTYHCFSKPWPFTWPAFVSPANIYSGKPA